MCVPPVDPALVDAAQPTSQPGPSSGLARRLAIGLALGFAAMLVVALFGDVRQVSQQVLDFQWKFFPPALLLTLLNYSLRFVKWHYYLGVMGVHDLPPGESARLFVAGFPLAVTPGKAGEALKAVWLQRASGLPVARGIAVVLAERISDGLAVLLLATLGVIVYPQYWPAFAIIFLGLVGVLVVSQVRPLALALLDLARRLPLVRRIAGGLAEFYEGSYILFRPRNTFVAVGLGTLSWLGEGIGFYLILLGLGSPAGWTTALTAVFVLSFSTVIGAVSTLPGGLGAAEMSIAGMLVLLLGMPTEQAAAATLLIRLATLWFGVGLGLVVWATHRKLFT